MARNLTLRQTQFLSAYLGESRGIGVDAARKAGYSGNDAALRAVASKLLTNDNIAAAIAAHKAQIESEGIANRTNRVKAQNERWEALDTIRRERAEHHGDDAPGSSTGFIVKHIRGVGGGEDFTLVDEFLFDKALFDAYTALEQHTAKELGQVIDRTEVTGKDGGAIAIRRYIGVDVDAV